MKETPAVPISIKATLRFSGRGCVGLRARAAMNAHEESISVMGACVLQYPDAAQQRFADALKFFDGIKRFALGDSFVIAKPVHAIVNCRTTVRTRKTCWGRLRSIFPGQVGPNGSRISTRFQPQGPVQNQASVLAKHESYDRIKFETP